MCLGIPGRITAIIDAGRLTAMAEVSGVRREVNLAPVATGDLSALVGQWALIHVGFAMAIIDEAEAAKTLQALRDLGEAQETLEQMAESQKALEMGGAR
jgi:hydrogenase expression/formation protein HypC